MVENPCATFLVSGPTYNKIKKLLTNNLTILHIAECSAIWKCIVQNHLKVPKHENFSLAFLHYVNPSGYVT